jgi:hypothetical protein
MALVAISIVAIVAMAGLSIDIGTLYQASGEAQRAADAGALAAARTISMQGVTSDPGGATSGTWADICGGGTSPASLAAKAVAGQSPISGTSIPVVTVSYSVAGGASSTDCSGAGAAFGVNPVVTVLVKQSNLPTYFSRIWGRTGNSVSATATAEVFNPSNSVAYAGSTVPVQPRCVKPWIVPNLDPHHLAGCTGTGCASFVDPTAGTITTPGIRANGGIIGERFWLVPDCTPGLSPCTLLSQPQANNATAPSPNLEYVPGQTSVNSIAVPSDGSGGCASAASPNTYAEAIAGCDQSTHYQCGVQKANTVDLSENPGSGDTTSGVQCLIHQDGTNTSAAFGQDTLRPAFAAPPSYPFRIEVGSANPLISAGAGANDLITSSTSIVSLPIYDSSSTPIGTGTTAVTVVGFLQVFINAVDASGNVHVTVMNVSGCGNAVASATPAVNGTSPVPVRLITPP